MRPKDHDGVVDSKLKVYGTANIRVADVSILPMVRLLKVLLFRVTYTSL